MTRERIQELRHSLSGIKSPDGGIGIRKEEGLQLLDLAELGLKYKDYLNACDSKRASPQGEKE